MRCNLCKRPIRPGLETQKMIADYVQPDATVKTFGLEQEDGPISAATGKIVRAYHCIHWMAARKRENRGGNAFTGRTFGSVSSAYEIGQHAMNREDLESLGLAEEKAGTQFVSDRIARLREIANEMELGIEDWHVKERLRREEHGDQPYVHQHMASLPHFQVTPHLVYAHGVQVTERDTPLAEQKRIHTELHAQMVLRATQQSREQDAGYLPPHEADWRPQEVHEVSDLPEVSP